MHYSDKVCNGQISLLRGTMPWSLKPFQSSRYLTLHVALSRFLMKTMKNWHPISFEWSATYWISYSNINFFTNELRYTILLVSRLSKCQPWKSITAAVQYPEDNWVIGNSAKRAPKWSQRKNVERGI